MSDRCHINTIVHKEKTSYSLFGEGPCVVFLHGYMEDGRIWDEVVRGLNGYSLLIPGLPGSGKELIPENTDAITFMADVVHELVLGLGFKTYSVVGNSMGGYVAFSLMNRYSDFLEQAVLISTNPFPDRQKDRKRRQREIALLKEGKRDLIFNLFLSSLDGRLRGLYEKMAVGMKAENMISLQKSMMNRPDNTALFIDPPVPLHYMIGEDDALIPVEQIKDLLAECEKADFETVKDATHFLAAERPGMVKDFILKSLKR